MMAKGRIVGQRYDEERGIWLYDIRIEPSPDDAEPAPRKFTLKQEMLLAIVRRFYRRRAIPSISTVTKRIANEWPAECARRGIKEIKPGQYDPDPPKRDAVARTLRDASLI
jgi:hypothetical protein